MQLLHVTDFCPECQREENHSIQYCQWTYKPETDRNQILQVQKVTRRKKPSCHTVIRRKRQHDYFGSVIWILNKSRKNCWKENNTANSFSEEKKRFCEQPISCKSYYYFQIKKGKSIFKEFSPMNFILLQHNTTKCYQCLYFLLSQNVYAF